MIDLSTLPETWIAVKLLDVAEVFMGQSPPGSSYNNDEIGLPLIAGAGDLGEVTPRPSKWTNAPTRICEPGDLIYCVRATIGEINWADRQYCLGRGVAGIRIDEQFAVPEYVYYWLNTLREYITGLGTGSTFLQIRRDDLESVLIPLPTLLEQQRIVTILHQANGLQQLRNQANRLAATVAKSVFEHMYYRHRQSWKSYRIGDVVNDIQAGKSIAARSYPARDNSWGILKVSAVTYGVYRPEENKELPEDIVPIREYEVRDGDLLVSRANTAELVGASVIVKNTPPRLLLPDKLWRLHLRTDLINPYFLYGLLNTEDIRREISLRATGTSSSMKNISQEKFLGIEIMLPSIDDQNKYEKLVSTIWNDIQKRQSDSQNLFKDTMSSLTSRAFIGSLTASWRARDSKPLTDDAIKRDIALGRRGKEPTIGDYESGRVTQAEREDIEKMLSDNMKPLLSQMALNFQSPIPDMLGVIQQNWNEQFAGIFNTAAAIKMPDLSSVVSESLSSALLGINTEQFSALSILNLGLTTNLISSMQFPLSSILGSMVDQFEGWDINDHVRYHALGELNLEQFRVYLACQKESQPFTVETIQEKLGESKDAIRRGLDLLASMGLIMPISLPAQSSVGETFAPAFRRVKEDDNIRLIDLNLLEEAQP